MKSWTCAWNSFLAASAFAASTSIAIGVFSVRGSRRTALTIADTCGAPPHVVPDDDDVLDRVLAQALDARRAVGRADRDVLARVEVGEDAVARVGVVVDHEDVAGRVLAERLRQVLRRRVPAR